MRILYEEDRNTCAESAIGCGHANLARFASRSGFDILTLDDIEKPGSAKISVACESFQVNVLKVS